MKYYLFALLFSVTTLYAKTYLGAKSGIATGDDIQLYTELKDHPLYPYLAADFYQKNIDRDTEIIALFKRYYAVPPIKSLHNRWIKKHFQQGDFQIVIANYYDTGSQTTNCIYRQSQLLLGHQKSALENIKQVWMSPKSVSNYCSPVFNVWVGRLSPKNILQRAKLAYYRKNVTFAQTMANKLSSPEGITIVMFSDFLRHPEHMLNYSAATLTQSALRRELLPLALAQLIRKDSSRYAAFAMQFSQKLKASASYQQMLTKLTSYLANRHDPQVQYTYALLSNPDTNATRSLLRFLVGSHDWAGIRQLISPNSDDNMALYWLARAIEANGENAKEIYRKVAKTRSYYGFLAADKIGQSYQFNTQSIKPNTHIQNNLGKNQSLIRGEMLYQLGESVAANKEILPVANKMDKITKCQLAYWLSSKGLHYDSIYILGKIRDWNDIGIRFPRPYDKQVLSAKALTHTDMTWIYAIIRQESSMNPYAVSSAKAKGLMQLIPSTARRMAESLGLPLSRDSIFDPDINIKLGTQYLSTMYQRFNNVALASGAYNAGPNRIKRWLANGVDDMSIWIEQIPFNETRKYVKNIIEYQQVYAKHLHQFIPTATEIINHSIRPIQPLVITY
ncbi:MAG: transglycosylase SLT domain-containing protein [Ostreibacterium sp.]